MDTRKFFTAATGNDDSKTTQKQAAATTSRPRKRVAADGESSGVLFKLEFILKTAVVEWDDATFTDCRPEEADYGRREHTEAARVADRSGTLTKFPTSELEIIEGVDEAASFARNFVEFDLAASQKIDVRDGSNFKVSAITRSSNKAQGSQSFKCNVDFIVDMHCGGDLLNKAQTAICCTIVPCSSTGATIHTPEKVGGGAGSGTAVTPSSKKHKPATKKPGKRLPSPQVTPGTTAEISAGNSRYRIDYTVKSKILEWDYDMFVDCRAEEAESAQDEHIAAVKQGDLSLGYSPTSTMSLDEANAAAVELVKTSLADGLRDAVREGTSYKTSAVKSDVNKAKGTGVHEMTIDFEIDVIGADLHNKAQTEIRCSVVRC